MIGDDPIADGLRRSFSSATKSIRPKARSTNVGGAGLFASNTISISISKNTAISPQRMTVTYEDVPVVSTEVKWRLPDSDRAKKLSQKDRQDKSTKRKATKTAKRRNRKK